MYIPNRSVSSSFAIVLVISFAGVLCSCDSFHRNKTHANVSISSIKHGKALAEVYCRSCHMLPDPSLLDAKSWEKGVLPIMGPRLGIYQSSIQNNMDGRYDVMLYSGYYPKKPVITPEQWQNIIDYYTATSPDSLPAQQRTQPLRMELPLFEVKTPALPYKNAFTSLVKIIDAGHAASLFVSDAALQKTFFLNKELQLVDSVATKGQIVNLEQFQDTMLLCNIGVMNPNDGPYGKASFIRKDKKSKWKPDTASLFQDLKRPVQVSAADLNNDGRTDYLVCEFGYITGSLCWMENKGNGGYQRHVLRALPGAIKAYFNDYNKDGLLDIWVLFAQGEEGVFLYTNKGQGRFEEQEVLRFPPVYGSSYFELADFNNDGYPDIVYTCGDNGDYSPVLKPYHGVYLFINNGHNSFSQKYFFPVNGCYKAIAHDFDKDGDLDLATISYFADYTKQPEEGFIYLENKANFHFDAYSLEAAKTGRWLTMDAGDIDGDGWTDLVLGNFCLGASVTTTKYDWRKTAPVMVLQNTGKK